MDYIVLVVSNARKKTFNKLVEIMIELDTDGQFSQNIRDNTTYDLADHFLTCAKLGRYLTVASELRFIITDDLRDQHVLPEAAAVAAIYSKDGLVAEAALLPLSQTIPIMDARQRDKYERLFHLIEEQTLAEEVRDAAQARLDEA